MPSFLQKCKKISLPANILALLVTNPTNVYYVTGLRQSHEERAFILLFTHKKIHLLTSPLHADQIRTNNITLHIASKEKPYSTMINDILVSENISKLHFESTDLRYSEHLIFRKKIAAKLLPSHGIVEELRMVKNPEELRYIRTAIKASLDLFSEIENRFCKGGSRTASGTDRSRPVPNFSEQSIKTIYDSFLYQHPEFSSAFQPIIAADAHAAIPHYSGYTTTPIKNMVLIDWGLQYEGYNADFTRVLFTKNAPQKMKNEYKILTEIFAHLARKIHVRAIHELPQQIYETGINLLKKHHLDNAFLRAGHALGHGVGLDIHEAPRIVRAIHESPQQKIKKGMVIALEPAVYFPKKYGLRYEDTIIV